MAFRKLKNKQKQTVKIAIILGLIFFVISVLPLIDGNPLTGFWALFLVGIFLGISCLVVALIFQKRAFKMEELLSGGKLIAEWQMDKEMIRAFVDEMKRGQKEKNKALIWVVGFFFFLFTIIFLIILDEDQLGFFLMMSSLFLIIIGAARFFPWYYKMRNIKGDGMVLLGSKYAYINGYFHNWDFPLSGLTKIKMITKPFNGIFMVYYYTDRTFTNSHELKIPVPLELDIKLLVRQLKNSN